MAKVIKETTDYTLIVGQQLDAPHAKCYQLINRMYDVVEAESQILPQAFDYMTQIQAALDAARDNDQVVTDRDRAVDLATPADFPH